MRRKINPISVAAGFTLLELLIVIGITGIITVMAIPQMGEMYTEYQLRSATRDIISHLRRMKMRAIEENNLTVMKIDEANDSYSTFRYIVGGDKWSLDAGEELDEADLKEKGLEITTSFSFDTLGYNGKGRLHDDVDSGGTIVNLIVIDDRLFYLSGKITYYDADGKLASKLFFTPGREVGYFFNDQRELTALHLIGSNGKK